MAGFYLYDYLTRAYRLHQGHGSKLCVSDFVGTTQIGITSIVGNPETIEHEVLAFQRHSILLENAVDKFMILIVRFNYMEKKLIAQPYRICSSCVMDTSDSKIIFDENGVCDHCRNFYSKIKPNWNTGQQGRQKLNAIIRKIKEEGVKKNLIA